MNGCVLYLERRLASSMRLSTEQRSLCVLSDVGLLSVGKGLSIMYKRMLEVQTTPLLSQTSNNVH